MGTKSFLDNEVRNQLTKKSYDNELTKSQIKTIIKTQTGLSHVPDFRLYTKNDAATGFDGYAIHFYDEKINEVYFFVRGTESDQFNDIYADAVGIAGGKSVEQIRSFDRMYQETIYKIKEDNQFINKGMSTLIINGDGHSLGGNVLLSVALRHGTFQTARGLNDAPVNVYQMLNYDEDFSKKIQEKFNTTKPETININKLLAFASEYYDKNSRNITHVRVKGEPLYAQSFPGKYYPGKNIEVLSVGDYHQTMEFPDISRYPLEELAKYSPLLRLEKLKYDAGVNMLIGGLRYTGGKYSTIEANAFFDEMISLYEDKEYRRMFTKSFDVTSRMLAGAGLLFSSFSGSVSQGVQIKKAFPQAGFHSIELLAELYAQKSHEIQSFYNFVDISSGEIIILERTAIKQFIIGCFQALEQKEKSIAELDRYIESAVGALYNEALLELHKKINRKEANPESFYNEVGPVYTGYSIWGRSEVIIDSVHFERDFDSMKKSVYAPLYTMRETLEHQRNHLQKFIHKVLALGEEVFKVDEELAVIIRKLGG